MLGETQENGDGHQVRSWVATVVRPGVVPAAGPAGENFQDLPERLGAQTGVPLRSSPEGHQGGKAVDAELLKESSHGAWRSARGCRVGCRRRTSQTNIWGTREPEKLSEHQQGQTGFGRGSPGVPQARCEECRLLGSGETNLEIRRLLCQSGKYQMPFLRPCK